MTYEDIAHLDPTNAVANMTGSIAQVWQFWFDIYGANLRHAIG